MTPIDKPIDKPLRQIEKINKKTQIGHKTTFVRSKIYFYYNYRIFMYHRVSYDMYTAIF